MIQQWRELLRFQALEKDAKSIVFYAEDEGSWRHFEPIIYELVERHGKQICYVTSSSRDPVLRRHDRRISTFCIGFGSARTMFFLSLKADVMVMTMPDLGSYYLKRSKHPTHYVYVFHSMVSSHMVYRNGAFDNFDSILCVGPHHKGEILYREMLYGLNPKNLVEAGYGLLDTILSTNEMATVDTSLLGSDGKRVLIAPSWGENGLLESHGIELVDILLQAAHHVTVRPHSMTIRSRPKLLTKLQKRFTDNPNFHLELDIQAQGSVAASDIMISDWSGAALEYAFGLELPVIFVDVPRKINNPEYEKIPRTPVEASLRLDIGEVISPEELSRVPEAVDRLCESPEEWKEQIRVLRSRWIYNIGNSGKIGAKFIVQAADKTVSG